VGLFRRREPLHERLAREGGLVERPAAPPVPPWREAGVSGLHRPRTADLTVTADAPDLEGNAVRWVVLPDRTILVEDGPDTSLEPLAAAVEAELEPPYRARAARQTGTLWAVQASRIEVLSLPDAPAGDAVDVARRGDESTFAVEGRETFGSLPALEERGAREGADYAVHAERLDGDLWEVRAAAL
jgi:hypothetical protein